VSTSKKQVQRTRGVGNDLSRLKKTVETVGHSILGEAKVQKYKVTTYILDYRRENRKIKTKENFSGYARSRSLQDKERTFTCATSESCKSTSKVILGHFYM
jgi:hypothetical protein